MVFARFIERRSLPNKIVSDNRRNFLGASRELSRQFASFINSVLEDITQKYVTQGFERSFIPAHAFYDRETYNVVFRATSRKNISCR